MSWHPTYHVHPAIAYSRSVVESMSRRTGRSMEEWVELARLNGPDGEKPCRDWLRTEHGLGGTTAAGVASFLHGDGRLKMDEGHYLASAPEMVDSMYGGKKAHLRAIHDRVIRLAVQLGDDVRISPTKTTVPLYRQNVFANLKPSTLSRVDLGLSIRQGPIPDGSDRIIDTGGVEKGDRITCRIPLTSEEDVDDFVANWLGRAYQEDQL